MGPCQRTGIYSFSSIMTTAELFDSRALLHVSNLPVVASIEQVSLVGWGGGRRGRVGCKHGCRALETVSPQGDLQFTLPVWTGMEWCLLCGSASIILLLVILL